MEADEFRHWSRRAADWGADYRARLRDLPVRPDIAPGTIAAEIAKSPPEQAEAMDAIFADFERVIVPGMTHWQHPRFFAYFPANSAPVGVVAEYLVTAMAAQCMLWQTSPAATELETCVVDWMRQAVGLPDGFSGSIQDSASTATLSAVLTMRERALGWTGNREGLSGKPPLRVYCSDQVHSSIDRAVRFAGIGEANLVKLPGRGPRRGLDPDMLEDAIAEDLASGFLPAGIVGCVGGTSTGGCDDIAALADVAARRDLHLHVDAAWAGSAMICPEFRHFWAGTERADTVVINPHKWLGAPFDCCVSLVRDVPALLKTLSLKPEYLKTYGQGDVVDYSEWSIPLGRRFRALKLWFLFRYCGLEGLRTMIRDHVRMAQDMARRLEKEPDFELVTEPMLSLFSFRLRALAGVDGNGRNIELLEALNRTGRIYLTQTMVDGDIAIRFQVGQMQTTDADVEEALSLIIGEGKKLAGK